MIIDLFAGGGGASTGIWADWLTPEERQLVWARALRNSWRTMCWKMGRSRTTVWKMWTAALLKIHAKLKETEK